MAEPTVSQAFAAALDALIAQIQQDRSILAAILCGSLAHDTVWAHSDIDLVLITIDDKKIDAGDVPLYAQGINVHAMLMPRSAFRKAVEGSVQNSFTHSFLAKGRLLYTHDNTITELCARLHSMGSRDARIQRLHAGSAVLPSLYKARKWFVTRQDFAYTALWLLYAAGPVARMEVIGAGLLADREVIPQALQLQPALMKTIYTDLLTGGTNRAVVERALTTMEDYLSTRAVEVFAPVLDYLAEVGDVRSSREIDDHFTKNFGISSITTVCEYLADLGLIGKASTPVLLTRRSNTSLEELAFFSTGAAGGPHDR